MRRIKKSQSLIVCPKTKQFTDLIVCAASCGERCSLYRSTITYEVLLNYVEKHPEYKIIGELMQTQKTGTKETKFWIINKDNTVEEVSEKDIMNNPKPFLKKQIWQKPPYRYKLVITLKRIKA